MVCNACDAETDRALSITNRERKDKKLPPIESSCAFCRVSTEFAKIDLELIKRYEERVDKGDVKAMVILAAKHSEGGNGLARDDAKAVALMQRAADLGFPEALWKLGRCFLLGEQGVIRDKEKGKRYLEDAAMKGDADARVLLGHFAEENQHHELAIRHYKLAAVAGHERAVQRLRIYFFWDKLTKVELDKILRAHHATCEEMNSDDRKRFRANEEAMAGNDKTLRLLYSGYYLGTMTAKELNVALKAHQSGDNDCFVQAILSEAAFLIWNDEKEDY